MTRAEWLSLRPGSIVAGPGRGRSPRLVLRVGNRSISLKMLRRSWRDGCTVTVYCVGDRLMFRVLRAEPRWFDPALLCCCDQHGGGAATGVYKTTKAAPKVSRG